jgi:hypothetical protein
VNEDEVADLLRMEYARWTSNSALASTVRMALGDLTLMFAGAFAQKALVARRYSGRERFSADDFIERASGTRPGS